MSNELLAALHYNYIDNPKWYYEYSSDENTDMSGRLGTLIERMTAAWKAFYR